MRIFLLNKNVEKPENLSDFLREKYKSFYGQLQLIEGKFYKTQFLNLANEHLKNFKLLAITLLLFHKPWQSVLEISHYKSYSERKFLFDELFYSTAKVNTASI